MIKAEDLRIGITLSILNPEVTKVVIPVTIDKERLIALLNGEEDTYFPIPLTPEILEAAGFVYDNNQDEDGISYWDMFLTDRVFSIGVIRGNFYFIDKLPDTYYKTEILYVHELQNLYYAVVKTELTINLNQLQQA